MTLEDPDRALIVQTLEQASWIVGGPTGGLCKWKAINKEGRHVGLDFYDLLIEGVYAQNPCSGILNGSGIFQISSVLSQATSTFGPECITAGQSIRH
jgi:hypothetical protein